MRSSALLVLCLQLQELHALNVDVIHPKIVKPALGLAAQPRSAASVPLRVARTSAAEMRLGGGGFGGGGGLDPRELITPAILLGLLASGALGWIFQGLFVFLFVVPLIVGPLISWYVNSNLLEGTCPECGSPAMAFKGQRTACMACGAPMSSDLSASGVFTREGAAATDDGVVEVEVLVDKD